MKETRGDNSSKKAARQDEYSLMKGRQDWLVTYWKLLALASPLDAKMLRRLAFKLAEKIKSCFHLLGLKMGWQERSGWQDFSRHHENISSQTPESTGITKSYYILEQIKRWYLLWQTPRFLCEVLLPTWTYKWPWWEWSRHITHAKESCCGDTNYRSHSDCIINRASPTMQFP